MSVLSRSCPSGCRAYRYNNSVIIALRAALSSCDKISCRVSDRDTWRWISLPWIACVSRRRLFRSTVGSMLANACCRYVWRYACRRAAWSWLIKNGGAVLIIELTSVRRLHGIRTWPGYAPIPQPRRAASHQRSLAAYENADNTNP